MAPDFVGGHAGVALTYAMSVVFGVSLQPKQEADTAISIAKKALAIDAEFAPAHAALGLGYLAAGEHNQAIAATRRATELQPGDADTYSCLGIALLFAGDANRASEAAEQAMRLDPQFKNGPYLNLLGTAKFLAGKNIQAIAAFERNVAQGGPMGPSMLHSWAAAHADSGDLEEARKIATELLRFLPEFSISGFSFLNMYKREKDKKRIVKLLKACGLPE